MMLWYAATSCSGLFSQTYTIKTGDTLSKIATSCSVSLQQLEAANTQIANFNLIHPGDTVCVPASCGSSGRKLLHSLHGQTLRLARTDNKPATISEAIRASVNAAETADNTDKSFSVVALGNSLASTAAANSAAALSASQPALTTQAATVQSGSKPIRLVALKVTSQREHSSRQLSAQIPLARVLAGETCYSSDDHGFCI